VTSHSPSLKKSCQRWRIQVITILRASPNETAQANAVMSLPLWLSIRVPGFEADYAEKPTFNDVVTGPTTVRIHGMAAGA